MTTKPSPVNQRVTERRPIALPARLMWTDQRGTPRFASVVTRDVSDYGVFVECRSALSIPLYRLVRFQLDREARDATAVPDALRQGRILSAVYRVTPPRPSGTPQGLALRLIIDPRRISAPSPVATRDSVLATA